VGIPRGLRDFHARNSDSFILGWNKGRRSNSASPTHNRLVTLIFIFERFCTLSPLGEGFCEDFSAKSMIQ
jgi:hypothetical protein